MSPHILPLLFRFLFSLHANGKIDSKLIQTEINALIRPECASSSDAIKDTSVPTFPDQEPNEDFQEISNDLRRKHEWPDSTLMPSRLHTMNLCEAYYFSDSRDSARNICKREIYDSSTVNKHKRRHLAKFISRLSIESSQFDSARKHSEMELKYLISIYSKERKSIHDYPPKFALQRYAYILAALGKADSALCTIMPAYYDRNYFWTIYWLVIKKYSPLEIRAQLDNAIKTADWKASEKSDTSSYYRKIFGANHNPGVRDSGKVTLFGTQFFLNNPREPFIEKPTRQDYLLAFIHSDLFRQLYCLE